MNELTWRQMRAKRNILQRTFQRLYLTFCLDRMRLRCERLEHLECLGDWAEKQNVWRFHRGLRIMTPYRRMGDDDE